MKVICLTIIASSKHTYQGGLEKQQELHSVQLQSMIQLLALRYSVNKEK